MSLPGANPAGQTSSPGANTSGETSNREVVLLARPRPLFQMPVQTVAPPLPHELNDIFGNATASSSGLSLSGAEITPLDPSMFVVNTAPRMGSDQGAAVFSSPLGAGVGMVTGAEAKQALLPPAANALTQGQTSTANASSSSGQAVNNNATNPKERLDALYALIKSNADLIRLSVNSATKQTIDKKFTRGPLKGMFLSTVVALLGEPDLMTAILEIGADPIMGIDFIENHNYLRGTSIPFLCLLSRSEKAELTLEAFIEQTLKIRDPFIVIQACFSQIKMGHYIGGTPLELAAFNGSVRGVELILVPFQWLYPHQIKEWMAAAIYKSLKSGINGYCLQLATPENTEKYKQILRHLMRQVPISFTIPVSAFMGVLTHAVGLVFERNFALTDLIKTLLEEAPEGSSDEIQRFFGALPLAASDHQKQTIAVLNEYLSGKMAKAESKKAESKIETSDSTGDRTDDAAAVLASLGNTVQRNSSRSKPGRPQRKRRRDEEEVDFEAQLAQREPKRLKSAIGNTYTPVYNSNPSIQDLTLYVDVQTSTSGQMLDSVAPSAQIPRPQF